MIKYVVCSSMILFFFLWSEGGSVVSQATAESTLRSWCGRVESSRSWRTSARPVPWFVAETGEVVQFFSTEIHIVMR